MGRILVLMAAALMFAAPASVEACNQCGCNPCQQQQQYKVVRVTTYKQVPTCQRVTTCKTVCGVDRCGCPCTKVVRETSYVRGTKCVPVTTCVRVPVCNTCAPAPCCCAKPAPACCAIPAPTCCDPCAETADRGGLLARLARR